MCNSICNSTCNSIIIRYGEIGIKGKNRGLFEKQLLSNIKEMLIYDKIRFKMVYRAQNRVIVEFDAEKKNEKDKINNEILKSLCSLKKIFGIISFSPALRTCLDLDEIKRNALLFYNLRNCEINEGEKDKNRKNESTFRITTQRINKSFPLNSQRINEEVGAFVVERTGAKVNLKKPEINIGIEILDNAYVFLERIRGLGGLPFSKKDFFAIELKNKNSLIASLCMMKRGLKPIFILKNKNYEKRRNLLFLIAPFLSGKLNIEAIEGDFDYENKIVEILNSKNAIFVSEIAEVSEKNIEELQKLKNCYGSVLAPLILMEKEKKNYYKKLLMKKR
ncbi:MAG: THUMP domain-containing protein [Candidatus Woesearchaeota archaeon]